MMKTFSIKEDRLEILEKDLEIIVDNLQEYKTKCDKQQSTIDHLRDIIRNKDEALEIYAKSTMGNKNEDGTYTVETNKKTVGGGYIKITFDPRIAQQALAIKEGE